MIGMIPGGMELMVLLLFVVPVVVAWYTRRAVLARGSDHGYAWGVFAFVLFMVTYGVGIVVFAVFYWIVREDIGEIDGGKP